MKKLAVLLLWVTSAIGGAALGWWSVDRSWSVLPTVHAQSFISTGPIAATVSACPTGVVPTGFAAQCPVGTQAGGYVYYQWNGTAWIAPAAPAISVVASLPLVASQSGNTVTITCPTCVTPSTLKASFDALAITATVPAQTVSVQ
jgi:hypothetical protein